MMSIDTDPKDTDAQVYWRANLRLMAILLGIWAAVSFGAGIVFRPFLDQFSFGGAPLGFWFAQQGSIFVFVILIFYYAYAADKLEARFGSDRVDLETDDAGDAS
jgi:putative solute:sodium symporter small subunit